MLFEKYIDLNVFIISFFIGMFMVYITVPYPEIVIKFPTPYNSNKIVYKDSADMCYVYDSKETTCSGKNISEIPVQIINSYNINNKNAVSKIFKKK